MSNGLSVSLTELIALKALAETQTPISFQQALGTGSHQTPLKGRGMEFAETRHYQAGDEIRHMEWRVTARTGRPHVKLYHAERDRPVLLFTDFNPSLYFGTHHCWKSVLTAQLAAYLAWRALDQKDKVGGLLCSATQHHEFSPSMQSGRLMRLLQQLVYYTEARPDFSNPPPPQSLSHSLKRLRRVSAPGSLLFLISDFYAFDEASDGLLAQLAKHHDVWALHVFDPLEGTPPPPGDYPMANPHQTLTFSSGDPQQVAAYTQAWQTHLSTLKQRLRRVGVRYLPCQTDQSIPTLFSNAGSQL